MVSEGSLSQLWSCGRSSVVTRLKFFCSSEINQKQRILNGLHWNTSRVIPLLVSPRSVALDLLFLAKVKYIWTFWTLFFASVILSEEIKPIFNAFEAVPCDRIIISVSFSLCETTWNNNFWSFTGGELYAEFFSLLHFFHWKYWLLNLNKMMI